MTTTVDPTQLAEVHVGNSQSDSGWGYIYVGAWYQWEKFKTRYLGPTFAAVLLVLSGVEIGGPFVHFINLHRHPRIQDAIVGALCLTALIVVWHHRVLHARADRYKNILSFAMVLAENRNSADNSPSAIVPVLDSVVRALNPLGRSEKSINAAILRRPQSPTPQSFRIFAQDSGNSFRQGLEIPDDSVAGKAVQLDNRARNIGGLVYVPWTKFHHGVAFRTIRYPHTSKGFSEGEIVPATYCVLDAATETKVLKCLLCIQVPSRSAEDEDLVKYQYVLSLSGQRVDCMDTVFFSAAKLVAAFLVDILA